MHWRETGTAWSEFVTRVVAAWPELDAAILNSMAGDRGKIVGYVAETFDLTQSEAAEFTAGWLLDGGAMAA